MDFLKYYIKDSGAFAPFISTMEDAGADIEGSRVMFESGNSAAKMLADTMVEYEIMSPVMESGENDGQAQAGAPKPARNPSARKPKAGPADPAAQGGEPGNGPQPANVNQTRKRNPKVASGKPNEVVASEPGEKNTAIYCYGDDNKIYVSGGKIVKTEGSKSLASAQGATFELMGKPTIGQELKAKINGQGWHSNAPLTSLGGTAAQANQDAKPAPGKRGASSSPDKQEVYQSIIEKIDSLGLDDGMKKAIEKKVTAFIDGEAKKAGDEGSEIYAKLAKNPMSISKIVFTIIQRVNPELYEELKEAGKLNDKGENTASLAQKTEISKALSQIVGQVEVPDAFNVEIDDSEWENALITAFGFPMINLTSTLVREMLRAQEPKAQKRAYKEFKKQLKSDPDVAKALGIGVMGTLGLGGGKKDATTDKKARIDTRVEGVNADGKVLVEGAITDISNALKNPVDVLKSIAGNKGTPCRRNNLVVMYKEIDGKSGDSNENVTVIPLGVSGGTLVDLNKSVPVPMSHLTAFYSVVDPKASFKSYAKAMAEVNTKSDNASKGLGDAAASAGKKLLSKIPLLGRGAKKELEAKEADGITKAMGELAMYIKENGHPPFYLLKPKSEPKEIDHWSDEDAANGYQMITMMVEGHKAGMILKTKTAEALFKVG